MNRLSLRRPLLLVAMTMTLSLSTTGCESASDLEKDADKAQNEADEKIANMKAETNHDAAKTQAEADKKIAESEAAFSKMREEYRHDTALLLVDLDKKIANLEAKALKSNRQAKADLNASLKLIGASRTLFLDDYKTLDHETGATWDNTKARLDREWKDLSTLVDKV